MLPEWCQPVVHRGISDDLFQGSLRESLPVRAFSACPRQVDRFWLADQVVELHQHQACVASS